MERPFPPLDTESLFLSRRAAYRAIRHHHPIENKLERKVFAYRKAAALRRIKAGMKAKPAI